MNKEQNMPKLNKGEWSEPYCLLKIITDQKLYLCNSDLTISGGYIDVTGGKLSDNVTYKICDDVIEFYIAQEQKDYAQSYIKKIVANALSELQKKQKRTFTIKEIENFYSNIGNPPIKSKSSSKSDCILSVFDDLTNSKEELNFTIKSFLSGSPSLINASKATNFNFKVSCDSQDYKNLKSKSLVRLLQKNNHAIEFDCMDNNTYEKNLMLVDTQMPLIISELLKIYYGSKTKLVSDIADLIKKNNPLKIQDVSIYENKLKDFLFYSSTGMVPNKEWEGVQDIDGGCLIVRNDGEVVTFYIFRKSFLIYFRNYLYNNCFLDTASTSRHDFGRLYQENNVSYLKLNLLVRIRNI